MDSPPIVPIAIGIVALAAFIIWFHFHRARKRREAFQAFASEHGLEYSAKDPFGLIDLPFALFRKGDGRGIENLVWGEWRGEPMRAFDHWYYEESTDSEGRTSRSYSRQSCVLLEVPAAFPHLAIGRENLLSRVADGLGFRDIELESPEFNRRFQVSADVRKFAYEAIDSRMMQWLLSLPGKTVFEISGRWVLAYVGRRVDPVAFAPIAEVARSFRENIPRAAWSLYGEEGTAERPGGGAASRRGGPPGGKEGP